MYYFLNKNDALLPERHNCLTDSITSYLQTHKNLYLKNICAFIFSKVKL